MSLEFLFAPATCWSEGFCYCNDYHLQIYTNLVFLFLAIIIIFKKSPDLHFKMTFVISILIAFLSSVYFHIDWNLLGQILDFSSVLLLLIIGELYCSYKNRNLKLIAILISTILIALILQFTIPESRAIVSIIPIIFIIYSAFLIRKDIVKLFPSIILFLVGGLLWILDANQIHCVYNLPILSLHSIWHLFTAIGIYYFYDYYNQALKNLKNPKVST